MTINHQLVEPKLLKAWPRSVNDKDLDKATEMIRDGMMKNIMRASIPLSRKKIDALALELLEAADRETLTLFDAVAAHTGKVGGNATTDVNAIFGDDLTRPGDDSPGGVVQWKPLSLEYAYWKAGRVQKRNKRRRKNTPRQYTLDIHELTGTMKRYFERNGAFIVHNRFGGIKANINYAGISERKLMVDEVGNNLGLGRIQLVIFPHIHPSLLPMLSSRRWNHVSKTPDLEHELLPPATYHKLSGSMDGPMRPLVTPIVQFYILHRIPGAVNRSLKKQFRTLLRPRRTSP